MKKQNMIVAGVMSGTSADGVDVALCRIRRASDGNPGISLIGTAGFDYPRALRAAVLSAMDARAMSVADMSRLHWRLGETYADAVQATAEQFGIMPDLVGCHGQTIYHQATPSKYQGSNVRCTWQIGEPSVIAERLRVPVVSDFRPADLAAGGQAAPLVPMLDYCMFRSGKVSRVLQNLGGIANMTAIPAGTSINDVMAFDTGPANMVIDACMTKLFNKKFDRDGIVAKRGNVLRSVVNSLLRGGYFLAPPPKSCGREEYGEAFVKRFLFACGSKSATNEDVIATATALTSESILAAYRNFVQPHLKQKAPEARSVELIVAGGGAKNATLMAMLQQGLKPLDVRLRALDDLGVPSQAKESVAFALLAWLTWSGLPGNVPSATGASRPVVLGKVTHA